MSSRPIVILTALDLEYDAVRRRLTGVREHQHDRGTRFEVGRLAGHGRTIALALVGKGNASAAVLAERAIAEFAPAALLFVGVAGALHTHVALGDVVVATHVYAYQGGTSEDDGLKGRPRVWEIAHSADQTARHVVRHHPGLTVHFGPIAAGDVVLNSAVSGHARWVRQHYNDALAIEMEGAGVAQAAHLNDALPVVVVRAISDRADGTKETTDRADWQQKAVANAAAFATMLAAELGDGPAKNRSTAVPSESRSREMASVRNVAADHAHVGVQAGHVYGNITIGAEPGMPASLAAQLADFRDLVQRSYAAGRLDEGTYAETKAELGTAEKQLEPRNRGQLLLTLKKVLGLVIDVAELAARLTTIIDAVKGMS